jgi:outer membrane protein OmpA-like peptidoglycan-associated protein
MIQGFFLRMDCRIRTSRPSRTLPAAVVAIACLALAGGAHAQSRGYLSSDPNVTVDLSVLGGPGNDPVAATPLPGSDPTVPDRTPSGLLFPPQAPPASRLNGQFSTLTPPQLRQPAPPSDAIAASAPTTATSAPTPPQSRLTVAPPAGMPAVSPPKINAPPAAAPATPKSAAPPAKAAASPVAPAAPKPATPTPPVAAPSPAPTPAPTVPTPPKAMASAPAAVPPPPTLPQPSAAPAPPPPDAVAEKLASVETAARPAVPAAPPGTISTAPDSGVRVVFESGSAKLPDAARDALLGLVGKLEANQDSRLQIEAYAAGTTETASAARRLSLSRALSVRSYLIEQGVRSTRMDVRALGNKPSDPLAPADRVDANLIER